MESNDNLKQLDELLAAKNQSWLLGAGISLVAGIPLMGPLTARVLDLARSSPEEDDFAVIDFLKDDLPSGDHIEHILSHLADYRALAERSKHGHVTIGEKEFGVNELDAIHHRTLGWIADTVRWGYVPPTEGSAETIGSAENPIIQIDEHRAFVSALFNRSQAGLAERRRAVRMFTTNYDTLIEDALSLEKLSHWDGFSGGAVGFRIHRYGDDEPSQGQRALVVKLHGSIDWHLGTDGSIWRVRDGDAYPEKSSRVLIYPQATKYVASQRDPFSAQFEIFRRSLDSAEENILATCGYSFGDDHINQEIELSLKRPESKTTLLAFSKQANETLTAWRNSRWGDRVYIISEDGLTVGPSAPEAASQGDSKLDWWTFAGVAKLLTNGAQQVTA